jgi:hypothetical protein
VDVAREVMTAFAREAPQTIPWLQCDRGADMKELLMLAEERGWWLTVRSQANRHVVEPAGGLLKDVVRKLPVKGTYELDVSAGPERPARRAQLAVRFSPLLISSKNNWTKKRFPFRVTVVEVLETGRLPKGVERLRWRLLTNRPVTTLEHARQVIDGYAVRWKIEVFHKTWKSICNVEDTQLRAFGNLTKWATITAAVAARIERLKHLSRETPDSNAADAFSRHELDAIIHLRKPAGVSFGDTLSLRQATRWMADIGGFSGSSAVHPGSIVLARGLERVLVVADVLRDIAPEGLPKKRKRRSDQL